MHLCQLTIAFTAGNLNLISNLTGSIDVMLPVLAQKVVPNISQLLCLATGIGIDIPLSTVASAVVGAGRLRREERGLEPWDLDDDNGFGDPADTDPDSFDLEAITSKEEEELDVLARAGENADGKHADEDAARLVYYVPLFPFHPKTQV